MLRSWLHSLSRGRSSPYSRRDNKLTPDSGATGERSFHTITSLRVGLVRFVAASSTTDIAVRYTSLYVVSIPCFNRRLKAGFLLDSQWHNLLLCLSSFLHDLVPRSPVHPRSKLWLSLPPTRSVSWITLPARISGPRPGVRLTGTLTVLISRPMGWPLPDPCAHGSPHGA